MKKIDQMHSLFGIDTEGRTCRDCSNCIKVKPHERRYRKCAVYGISSSNATDWAGRWQACGHINKPLEDDKICVIKQIKPERKHGELDGQIDLLGKEVIG